MHRGQHTLAGVCSPRPGARGPRPEATAHTPGPSPEPQASTPLSPVARARVLSSAARAREPEHQSKLHRNARQASLAASLAKAYAKPSSQPWQGALARSLRRALARLSHEQIAF
jgi:hypothetical protein